MIGMISGHLVHGQSVTITTIPNPANICAGQSISLQANPIGAIDSTYLWTPGGETTQTIVVYPATTTIYMVSVHFIGGATAVAYQTVTVAPNPTPTITSIPTVPVVCEGQTVQLISSPADTYQWYLNDTLIAGATSHNYTSCIGGSYKVYATIGSCSAMSTSTLVTVNPLPLSAGTILGPSIVCQGTTASFFTGNIPYATEYVWSMPTGTTIVSGQGTQTITVTFTTAGSGYISVRGHNACGDGQPFILPITINDTPTVNVVATNTNPCAGTSISITAEGNGTSFLWSPSGKTTQTIEETPVQPTTYSVIVSLGACTANRDIFINVHELPLMNLALSPSSVCTDENSITLEGGSPAGTGGTGVYIGNCVFGNNTVYPSVSPIGTYPIVYRFTDSWGCIGTSQAVNFTIYPVPELIFSNVPYPLYTDADPINLDKFVNQTGCVFSGPGVILGTSVFDPEMAGDGIHMITCTYTHPISGCSATQIQYIRVIKALGIKEFSAAVNKITIFPNPAEHKLSLVGVDVKKIHSISIVNTMGETLFTTTDIMGTMCIDISLYTSGSYVLHFMDSNGFSRGRKFMKK